MLDRGITASAIKNVSMTYVPRDMSLCLFLSRSGCSKLLTIDNKCRGPVFRKPGLFAQLLQVLQCFAQCPYRSSIRQHQASWCLLIRQKPTMATIDASLDELTGATIIITTTIISTTDRWRDGSQPISFTAPAKFDCTAVSLRSAEITSHGKR